MIGTDENSLPAGRRAEENPDKAREHAGKTIPDVTSYIRDAAKFRKLQAELCSALDQ